MKQCRDDNLANKDLDLFPILHLNPITTLQNYSFHILLAPLYYLYLKLNSIQHILSFVIHWQVNNGISIQVLPMEFCTEIEDSSQVNNESYKKSCNLNIGLDLVLSPTNQWFLSLNVKKGTQSKVISSVGFSSLETPSTVLKKWATRKTIYYITHIVPERVVFIIIPVLSCGWRNGLRASLES